MDGDYLVNAQAFVTGIKCGAAADVQALGKWLNTIGRKVNWSC